MNDAQPNVPYGYCHCGCGRKTNLAKQNHAGFGWKKGEPLRFVKGHHARKFGGAEIASEDRGFTSPCWVWQMSFNSGRYGRINRDGEQLAHRWYYIRHNGPIPEGHEIDHLCGHRDCVNPDHLDAVTRTEHKQREKARGTHAHVPNPVRVLVDETFYEVCAVCRGDGYREDKEPGSIVIDCVACPACRGEGLVAA